MHQCFSAAISNCDPKKMGFNGGYNCSGEGMDFGCALWCPERVEFEFPQADLYSCDYATGIWSPSPIPQCDYSKFTRPDGLQGFCPVKQSHVRLDTCVGMGWDFCTFEAPLLKLSSESCTLLNLFILYVFTVSSRSLIHGQQLNPCTHNFVAIEIFLHIFFKLLLISLLFCHLVLLTFPLVKNFSIFILSNLFRNLYVVNIQGMYLAAAPGSAPWPLVPASLPASKPCPVGHCVLKCGHQTAAPNSFGSHKCCKHFFF